MSITTAVREPKLITIAGDAQERIRGRQLVAQSDVSIELATDEAVEKCLRALEVSDLHLAEKPQKYDWKFVWVDPSEQGGGRVNFGVAWYDEEFFDEKRDVYLDTKHLRMIAGFGADDGAISVSHYKLVA